MAGLDISEARSTNLEDDPVPQAPGCSVCSQTKHLAPLMVFSHFYGIKRCPLCSKLLSKLLRA